MNLFDYNPVLSIDGKKIKLLEYIQTLETTYFSFLEFYRKKQFVRHLYYKSKKGLVQEVYREFEDGRTFCKNCYMGYGANNGFHCFSKTRYSSYSGTMKFRKEMYECRSFLKIENLCHVYELVQFTQKAINCDESLKYSFWNDNVDALNYIKVYRKYPIVEMLMKLEMYHLVFNEKVLEKMSQNKTFCKYIYKIYEKLKNCRISGKYILAAFNQNKDLFEYYSKCYQTLVNSLDLSRDLPGIYRYLKKIVPLETCVKVRDYLKKNNISASLYEDYIKACIYLKLDFTNTKTLFPEEFMVWHDKYCSLMDSEKNRIIDSGIESVGLKFHELEKAVCDLKFIFPKKSYDMVEEGTVLNHCVGRLGYNKKMADGKSLIIFIRHLDNEKEPFVTMEFDLQSKKVLQLFAKNNNEPDEHVKEAVYHYWLPATLTYLKEMR